MRPRPYAPGHGLWALNPESQRPPPCQRWHQTWPRRHAARGPPEHSHPSGRAGILGSCPPCTALPHALSWAQCRQELDSDRAPWQLRTLTALRLGSDRRLVPAPTSRPRSSVRQAALVLRRPRLTPAGSPCAQSCGLESTLPGTSGMTAMTLGTSLPHAGPPFRHLMSPVLPVPHAGVFESPVEQ